MGEAGPTARIPSYPRQEAIVKVEGSNLEVLPVRRRPSNPSELLASERMRELTL